MARESDDVVDVELVEVDVHEFSAAAPLGPGRAGDAAGDASAEAPETGAAHRRARRLRWVGAAVLSVLAIAAVVVNVVDVRAAAERRRAIGTWALSSLDRPLEEAWRAEARSVVGSLPGAVLLQSEEALEAVDPATGGSLWSLPAARGGEYCFMSTERSWYLSVVPPGDPIVLCETSGVLDDNLFGSFELRSVDPVTGTVLDTYSVASGRLVSLPSASEALLVGWADELFFVERRDLRSGSTVWRHEEPASAMPEDRAAASIQSLTSVVRLSLVDGTIGLDIETGEQVDDPFAADAVALRWDIPHGRAVEVLLDPSAEGGARTRLVDVDGREIATVAGLPLVPSANDGDLDVLCLQPLTSLEGPGAMVAVDAETGEELWRADETDDSGSWSPLLQSDGRFLTYGPDVRMRDMTTGREVWHLEVSDMVSLVGPATDGDVVVLPVSEDDGRLAFAAVSLADGQERWRVPAPDGTVTLTSAAQDDLVLVTTMSDEVVALRSP